MVCCLHRLISDLIKIKNIFLVQPFNIGFAIGEDGEKKLHVVLVLARPKWKQPQTKVKSGFGT